MSDNRRMTFLPMTLVETVVLGLYWNHWPAKRTITIRTADAVYDKAIYTYTTVDRVLKVLVRLGHITEGHIKCIHHKTGGLEYQRVLFRHCAIGPRHARQTNSKSWVAIYGGSKMTPERCQRLVFDTRLELIEAGAAQAQTLERLYNIQYGLNKQTYVECVEAINAEMAVKSQAGEAAVSKIYLERIEKELS